MVAFSDIASFVGLFYSSLPVHVPCLSKDRYSCFMPYCLVVRLAGGEAFFLPNIDAPSSSFCLFFSPEPASSEERSSSDGAGGDKGISRLVV